MFDWFNVKDDHLKDLNEIDVYKINRINTENLNSNDCIIGHYAVEGIYLHQRYPEILTNKDRVRAFTFLRDPFEFFLSFYYYSKENNRMDLTLQEFLKNNKNLFAYYLPCNESNFREVLDRYFFIGIVEKFEESVKKLSVLLNRNFTPFPRLNVTKRDDQLKIVNKDFKVRFKQENELDYKIYKYALEKFMSVKV